MRPYTNVTKSLFSLWTILCLKLRTPGHWRVTFQNTSMKTNVTKSLMNYCLFKTQDPWSSECELSNLDYMDFWMRSIHAHTAENTRKSPDNMTLSPPIFIVGTHRNSLSDNPDMHKRLVRFWLSILHLWHDQGKWVTCWTILFPSVFTPLFQNLQLILSSNAPPSENSFIFYISLCVMNFI